MDNKILIDEMEKAASKLRDSLGYGENEFVRSFDDLLNRVRKIENLVIKQYDSPLRPMSSNLDNGFKIVIGENLDERTSKEQLLHEIAHVLFDSLPQYNGGLNEFNEKRADIFARCFLMPKSQFMEALINNSNSDELVNINGIAEVFNVNIYMVMKRGEELLGWK